MHHTSNRPAPDPAERLARIPGDALGWMIWAYLELKSRGIGVQVREANGL